MTTLLRAFSVALPDFSQKMIGKQRVGKNTEGKNTESRRTERRQHTSGSNTQRCEPPASAIKIPVEHWIERANTLCLGKPEVQTELRKAYMPLMEQAHLLNSEEDIVVASAQHFTYPVNTALHLVRPTNFVLSEVSKSKDNLGTATSSLSRVDRMYFKGPPDVPDHPGKSKNTMACLEFKGLKALNSNEFKSRIVDSREAYDGRVAGRRATDADYTPEAKNVTTLLKQATNYAIKFKTPFVALFDIETLVLLVMTEAGKEDDPAYGGNFTYMTVVTGSDQLCKAMLGFLLCADLSKGNNDSWHIVNGTDILIDPTNLPSMGPGGAPGSRTLPDRTARKRSYKDLSSSQSGGEGGSQSSSQERGHAPSHAAHNGPAAPGGPRKPPALVKSSSGLSSHSTSSSSSASSGTSSASVMTASSTGSAVKPSKPNPNARITTTTSATKTATATAQPPTSTTTTTSSNPTVTKTVKQLTKAALSPAPSAAKKTVRG